MTTRPLPTTAALLLLVAVAVLASLPSGTRAFTWTACTPDPPPSASSSAAGRAHAKAGAADPAAAPLLTPTTVTLTPDPPVIGSGVEFLIKGPLSAPITKGTIGLRVKFEGVELYEEEADVCEKLEGGCSAAAGGGGESGGEREGDGAEATIRYLQDLPPIAPPGHYSVRVVGTTGDDIYDGEQAVVCVDVEFDMVLPSRRFEKLIGERPTERRARVAAAAAAVV